MENSSNSVEKLVCTQNNGISFFFFWNFFLKKFICLFIFFYFFTCVPHPEPPSLLPPHTIPLGRSSALAPSIQYCASNLDWHLISYFGFVFVFFFESPLDCKEI